MDRTISPVRCVSGTLRLPGDKSISHRLAMLGAVAEGRSVIDNYASGADCASTLACLRALGVPIQHDNARVIIEGAGLDGLLAPDKPLDAGNSGSTMRMLSGILAGQDFRSEIGGDESLSRRPMKRIITPLANMGARIEAREGQFPPLKIQGGKLEPIEYQLPVASAQVKTCILFAGMFAAGRTSVREPVQTRNHTEIALREFGAELEVESPRIAIRGRPALRGRQVGVPADLSSAAFFVAAGLLLPGSHLVIEDVGLNPTRTAFVDVLREMGAELRILRSSAQGEPRGDLEVRGPQRSSGAPLTGGIIDGATTAGVIDEIPILAVLGAAAKDGLTVRDAAELRVKETDRIAAVADNLQRMDVEVEVFEDGMKVPGGQKFHAAELDSFGDHRIAMAFSIAALAADGPCVVRGAETASISFPEFYQTLEGITG